MTSMTKLLKAALATAVVAGALGPAAAADAATSMYSVTFKAQMTDRWQMREHLTDDCNLTGNMCVREEVGQGSAKLDVRTRRPAQFMVMTGGGRPRIGVGTGEGAAIAGPYLRTGSLETTWSGPWDAGNPDQKAPTSGCGNKTIAGDMNFVWQGRNRLAPSPVLDDERDACPTGPSIGWEWSGGEAPSLRDVVAQAGETKFGRTKQFTVRGTKTWTGIVDPIDRSDKHGTYTRNGSRSVTWSWEATFRKLRRR